MKKISELKSDCVLILGDDIIFTKEELLRDADFIKNPYKFKNEIYTAKAYCAKISAKEILKDALEKEYENMYEDWLDDIIYDITNEDIKDIQDILNKILARSKEQNITYMPNEKVEIDYKEINNER